MIIDKDPISEKINWGPTINTNLPETFQYEGNSEEIPTGEQENFFTHIREFLDETHLASLCCELVIDFLRKINLLEKNDFFLRIHPMLFIGDYQFIILFQDCIHF